METLQTSPIAPSIPLQTFGVNDLGLSYESCGFIADFPEPSLRIPPFPPLFDLLSERPLLDGEGNMVPVPNGRNRGFLKKSQASPRLVCDLSATSPDLSQTSSGFPMLSSRPLPAFD